jgi:REP element-mobilizing transposase RayT
MPEHVHTMISIPPKYAVSQVIGYSKGKSAIHLFSPCVRGEEAQFRVPALLCQLSNRSKRLQGRAETFR